MRRETEGFHVGRRHLPHWEEPGATYFLTLALRRPPVVDLTDSRVAPVVVSALRFRDGERYWLYDYTVMPDHVHAILKPITYATHAVSLSLITHGLKSWSAHEINRVLGRAGSLWQEETHDHLLRNEADYHEKAAYILQNAHDAGLVDDPLDWPWWGTGRGPQA